MNISKNDKNILRELAKQKLEYAKKSQQINIKLWTDINDLKVIKPPIYINEIPFHEMNVSDELTLQTEHPFCKNIETKLRREIYCYKHMPGNMVILPTIDCPVVINDTGLGICEDVDIIKTDDASDVVSRHFNIQIKNEDDIDKIKDPIVSIDTEKTELHYATMKDIFDSVLEVRKIGVKGYWFTPWDNLIRWTGVTEAMMDLIDKPEYIDKLVERFVDASIARLEQLEKLGLWASNNDNARVGSGGYGYCSDLEPPESHLLNAPLDQLWGCGNAQIFSEVSPAMHWDFSLKHEMRWLKRFGLTYYGCCEALHNKFSILEKIPNLRKISMSPWSDLNIASEFAKDKYVLSCKPNPAIFTDDCWDEEQAKKEIAEILKKTKGCSIEIIMKDISTVNYKPERLWRWSEIALETVDEYYK